MPYLQLKGNYIDIAKALNFTFLVDEASSAKSIANYKEDIPKDIHRSCYFNAALPNTTSAIVDQQNRLLKTSHLFDETNQLKHKNKAVSFTQGDFIGASLSTLFIYNKTILKHTLEDTFPQKEALANISLNYINEDDVLCGFSALQKISKGKITYTYCVIEDVTAYLEDRKVSVFFDINDLSKEDMNVFAKAKKLQPQNLSDRQFINAITQKIKLNPLSSVMRFDKLNQKDQNAKAHFQSIEKRATANNNFTDIDSIAIIPNTPSTVSFWQTSKTNDIYSNGHDCC